jgi:hypothetical protein
LVILNHHQDNHRHHHHHHIHNHHNGRVVIGLRITSLLLMETSSKGMQRGMSGIRSAFDVFRPFGRNILP